MIVALVSGQHMHLLIALSNQIDHFLLAGEQRRQGGRGSVCWVSRLYLASQ